MIIRQLTLKDYEALREQLIRHANAEPFSARFTVPIKVNKTEYAVTLQPDRHRKMAVLQALHVQRDEDGHQCILITDNGLLTAFLDSSSAKARHKKLRGGYHQPPHNYVSPAPAGPAQPDGSAQRGWLKAAGRGVAL